MRTVLGALFVLCLGCGRLGFERVTHDAGRTDAAAGIDAGRTDAATEVDGGSDGGNGGNDGGPDAGAPMFAPAEPIDGLASATSVDDPTMRPDLLEIYFNQGSSIVRAVRASSAVAFETPIVVAELESAALETSPELSFDGLTLHFSTTRDGGAADLWIATRSAPGAAWMNAAEVVELNTSSLETNPTMTPDELRMVFSRGPTSTDRDLFEATRDAPGAWMNIAPIDELNTTANDAGPMLARGGLTIIFFSNRPGARGDDLYIATRPSLDEPFGEPMPIAEVNTAGDDEDPWLSEDTSTLVFSRDGDLFITSR